MTEKILAEVMEPTLAELKRRGRRFVVCMPACCP